MWSLTFSKISKIGATRCHILGLKCTKFDMPSKGKGGEGWEGKEKGKGGEKKEV